MLSSVLSQGWPLPNRDRRVDAMLPGLIMTMVMMVMMIRMMMTVVVEVIMLMVVMVNVERKG